MALDREYKITASTRTCESCGSTFVPGDDYYSAVVEAEGEETLARQDFCPACWNPAGRDYFSFWRARLPLPEQPKQQGVRLVDLGRLLQLFEHLADSDDEQAQRFRYVLALVLMRKRRLRLVSSRRGRAGRGEVLTLREVGADRQHVVDSPSIADDEIRSVADRLRDVLDMPERWDQLPDAEPADAAEGDGPEADRADTEEEEQPVRDDDDLDRDDDEDEEYEDDLDDDFDDEDDEYDDDEEDDDEDRDA